MKMRKRHAMTILTLAVAAFLCVPAFLVAQETAAPPPTDAQPVAAPPEVAPAAPEAAPVLPAAPADQPQTPAATNQPPAAGTQPATAEPAVPPALAAPTNAPAPDATVEQTGEAAPTESDGSVEIAKDEEEIEGATASKSTADGNLISVTLDDVEMVDVVKMFTRISGANIIATPSNLQGRVTVNLTDVEWKPALTSILKMHALGLLEETPGSGVYSIVPKPAGAPEPLLVETYFMKFASVSNVFPVVNSMVAAPGGVSAFPARNALVVRSTASNLGEVKKVIASIDTLRDQVYIESKFLELNDSAIKDLGINWQVLQSYNVGIGGMRWNVDESKTWNDAKTTDDNKWDNRNHQDNINKFYDINMQPFEDSTLEFIESPPDSGNYITRETVTPTREVTDAIDKGRNLSSDIQTSYAKIASDVRTAVLSADDFSVILSALKTMNGVTVVSNPKIVVANEEPAIIHIGQTERPFISQVTAGQQGIAPVVTYNPGDPVKLGVELTVTPTVNTESNITVKIMPTLRRFLRDAIAPNGQTFPVIAEKKIQTTFCLESGKTAAIGGLTETRDQDVSTKIPLLGSIPIIGKFLFSHTHQEKSQAETIIFVTVGLARPPVMTDTIGLPEDTELAKRHIVQRNLQRKVFNQEMEQIQEKADRDLEKKTRKVKSRLLAR